MDEHAVVNQAFWDEIAAHQLPALYSIRAHLPG